MLKREDDQRKKEKIVNDSEKSHLIDEAFSFSLKTASNSQNTVSCEGGAWCVWEQKVITYISSSSL